MSPQEIAIALEPFGQTEGAIKGLQHVADFDAVVCPLQVQAAEDIDLQCNFETGAVVCGAFRGERDITMDMVQRYLTKMYLRAHQPAFVRQGDH
jgi:hypothetical protein